MRQNHDELYSRFFSNPEIVAQLLRGFVAGPWLDGLDFARMERLNAKFHAETGQRREGDAVWRIPNQGGGTIYVLLLLEFQSTVDSWMTLRVLTYACLLWQHLIKERVLRAGDRLPPILPVVVYNGDDPWTAPTEMSDLLAVPPISPLGRWQPSFRCFVIDEGRFDRADLASRPGLPALLFLLENAKEPADILAATEAIVAWFRDKPGFQEARSVFRLLLASHAAEPGSTVDLPEELEDLRNMLATRMAKWEEDVRQEERQEGRKEGRQEGEALLLIDLLERRFEPLTLEIRSRIMQAESRQIKEWSIRLLDADSINDVLS